MTKISDLPMDLAEEVLSRLPRTSLRAVRFTCKTWNTLSKRRSFTKKHIIAKANKKQGREFQAIMTMHTNVYLMSVNLHGIRMHDNAESSIKQKCKLISLDDADRINISQVYHCNGLMLCITNGKKPRLVVWNPYCGQTRCIKPLKSYHKWDKYALGYEENNNGNRNYKILRYLDAYECMSEICGGENKNRICEFDSNSWKVIEVNPDWKIYHSQRGVSLKGNTYWFAEEIIPENPRLREEDKEIHSFLVCFYFTNERFGSRLSVPFDNHFNDTVKLSTVREKKLAVLHQRWTTMCRRIWISNKVDPNALSWSKLFLQVGWIRELDHRSGSFFVDEEENVAVTFDKGKCRYNPTRNTAYIVRENEYIKEVDLGESVDKYCFPLVCSKVCANPATCTTRQKEETIFLDETIFNTYNMFLSYYFFPLALFSFVLFFELY